MRIFFVAHCAFGPATAVMEYHRGKMIPCAQENPYLTSIILESGMIGLDGAWPGSKCNADKANP